MNDLEENKQLGFLVSDSARLLKKIFDRRVKQLGVTRSQWMVLVQLMRQEGLAQTELADLVEIEQPSLVRHLDRLVKSGLLIRRPDREDRRVNRIFLNKKSRGLLEKIEPEALSLLKEFVKGLTGKEQETLFALLSKVKNNLLSLEAEKRQSL